MTFKYNIGDMFLSGGDTILFVDSISYGPSELLNEGENGTFYRLTFLNGKPKGKSTWILEEEINQLINEKVYIHYPVKE
jgi:hypothetical protein